MLIMSEYMKQYKAVAGPKNVSVKKGDVKIAVIGVFVLFKGCGDSNDDNQEARIERLQKEITDITTDINIDYAEYNYGDLLPHLSSYFEEYWL